MPTPYDNLVTRYTAICTELATIQNQAVNRTSDQGSSRKGELESYRLKLYQELAAIRAELAAVGIAIDPTTGAIDTGGPFEIESQGF